MNGTHLSEKPKNATHLFESPDPKFHNSEKWWTSLFSLVLLHLAQQAGARIPIALYQ